MTDKLDAKQVSGERKIFVSAPADVVAGVTLFGGEFNMAHPLSGGGMTVALSNIQSIRQMLRTIPSLHDSFAIAKQLATHLGRTQHTSNLPQQRWQVVHPMQDICRHTKSTEEDC